MLEPCDGKLSRPVLRGNGTARSLPYSVLKKSKLPKESVINVSQIITIDKSFLTDKVHTLSNKIMAQVDEGVKLVLKQ
jgi:mRNA-degrading endonuclease toxin of MazEF toxin-antitoxin module